MKLQELRAVCEGTDALERMRDRPEWTRYVTWNDLMAMAARSRDPHAYEAEQRRLFAADLPDALVRHVLTAIARTYYRSGARIVAERVEPDDLELTGVEVFEQYGGAALVDVRERGVHDIVEKSSLFRRFRRAR